MIELIGVTQRYHSNLILDQIDLSIQAKECCALVGRNGVGKSTLIQSMLGFLPVQAGHIRLNGIHVRNPAWKKHVAYLPEKFQLYPHLTAYENIHFFGSLYDKTPSEQKIETSLRQVDLWDQRDQFVRSFSKGMLQRLGLGIMLYYDAPILILDEPTSGLDPVGRIDLLNLLKSLTDKTILFSSHHLDEIKQVCTHVALLHETKIKKYPIDQFEEKMMLGGMLS